MSGCGDVCLDHSHDGHNEFFSQATAKARKEHVCEECCETIRVGQQYERSSGKSEGLVWTVATCLRCREIREAFVCGFVVFGMLYESIEEEMFPVWNERGPIDCLAKLESRDARDYLRDMYREWAGEEDR